MMVDGVNPRANLRPLILSRSSRAESWRQGRDGSRPQIIKLIEGVARAVVISGG
jgi:hypothetical protein